MEENFPLLCDFLERTVRLGGSFLESCKKSRVAFGDGKEGGHCGGAEKFKCIQGGNHHHGFLALKLCKPARNPGTQELFPGSLQVMRRKCREKKKKGRERKLSIFNKLLELCY